MTGSVFLSVLVLVIGCSGQGLFSELEKRIDEASKYNSKYIKHPRIVAMIIFL